MIDRNLVITIGIVFVAGLCGFSKADASSAACDRECLKGIMTKYLDALTAKKPDSLPLDANVRFTENCKELKVGEGYWKDVNGTVRYRLDIIDVNQSGAGALVVIKGSASVLFAIRLKIANQKITEIETMVTKNSSEGMIFTPDGFKDPPADSMMTVMPKTELLNTRDEMIAIASKYPEAMKQGKANFNANGLYFTQGTFRLENGQRMAGPGCVMGSGCENIGKQGLPKLSGMIYKTALVDEQAGIVFLRMNFGKGSLMSGSGTLDVFEAFKVYNDSMHAVYAVMHVVPEGTGFGWDYTSIDAAKRLSPAVAVNRAVPAANGVWVPLEFPYDKIILDIYTAAGRLVSTKNHTDVQKNRAMFLTMDRRTLGAGHFIGCVRCFVGGKMTNSLLFSFTTIR